MGGKTETKKKMEMTIVKYFGTVHAGTKVYFYFGIEKPSAGMKWKVTIKINISYLDNIRSNNSPPSHNLIQSVKKDND